VYSETNPQADAYDSQGFTDITVDGRTWELRRAYTPLANGRFAIQIQDNNSAVQLQRILVPSARPRPGHGIDV
jgi:hypothetical protein